VLHVAWKRDLVLRTHLFENQIQNLESEDSHGDFQTIAFEILRAGQRIREVGLKRLRHLISLGVLESRKGHFHLAEGDFQTARFDEFLHVSLLAFFVVD